MIHENLNITLFDKVQMNSNVKFRGLIDSNIFKTFQALDLFLDGFCKFNGTRMV